MKQILRLLFAIFCLLMQQLVLAQCTNATLNWDNLDYYYNSGNNIAPYGYNNGNYITSVQERTQKFAIGGNWLTIAASASGIVKGENGSHDGDLAGYAGDDAQFTPTANTQTITITFNQQVENASFVLYDIDRSGRIDVTALNAANNSVNVNVGLQASTILSVSASSTSPRISASTTSLSSPSNQGTATISINEPVNQITLTINNLGSDPTFWLSDINACVNQKHPLNYHQTDYLQPFTGQPDYFITTPDNNSAYMIDPATGRAWHLFTDASNTYMNSFAYDGVNKLLYYISESAGNDANNKVLKRYDFNTETSTTLGNLGTILGMPFFDQGIQTGGAAFYNGDLYIGIEGGRHSTGGSSPTYTTRESIIWKIEFDAGLNLANVCQAFATDAYNSSGTTSLHDWGDFIIKDGVLYDFNTARNNTNYSTSSFIHFNMTTGIRTTYTNPGTGVYSGQAGMNWSGNLYALRNVVEKYDLDGTKSESKTITVVKGPAWVANAGDASDPFRPKMDFGDAPGSYDPDPLAPAVHELDNNLHIGPSIDREWVKNLSANNYADADADGSDEDGLPFVTILTTPNSYLTETTVFNNTGAPATLCAWLDFDMDGIFEENEGIMQTIPSGNFTQTVSLFWENMPASLPYYTQTYLRIRITSAANNMTKLNATGYFPDGEVEDYAVPLNYSILPVDLLSFDAKKDSKDNVMLQWKTANEYAFKGFEIQRSVNNNAWTTLGFLPSKADNASSVHNYIFIDSAAVAGKNFYRLKMIDGNDAYKYSQVESVTLLVGSTMHLMPNPVQDKITVNVKYPVHSTAYVRITNLVGATMHSQTTQLVAGNNYIYINSLQSLPKGTYMLQLITPHGRMVKQFLKE